MTNCIHCGFKKWIKTGKVNKQGLPYWKCGRCSKLQVGDTPFIRTPPKELYLDIETSLTDFYGNFGRKVRGEYINSKMIKHPYFIICWSALWTDKPNRIYSGCVTKDEALQHTDKNIVAPLWDLINRADVVAGHNVASFDMRRINTRFKINGFDDPLEYKQVDTLKIARRKYSFEDNSLDYLLGLFGLPHKDKMQIEDWIAIQETGDEKTLGKMLKYNKGDVRNGAKILEILRQKQSPDFGMTKFPTEPKDKRL